MLVKLYLALEPPPIVLARTLNVIVHLLDVRHKI